MTTAHYNTFLGAMAGAEVTTGGYNTAIGVDCADLITTGIGNIVIGYAGASYGVDLTTGSHNYLIGNYTHTSASDVSKEIVMGYNVVGNGTGTFTFGDATSDTSCAFGGTTWSNPSDERIKEEIEDEVVGLSFINDLRPRTFRYRQEKDIPEELDAHVSGSEKRYKTDKYEHGFIAQEVKEAIDKHSSLKDGFDMWKEDPTDGRQRIGETAVIPMLIKAIQELSAEVEKLKGD